MTNPTIKIDTKETLIGKSTYDISSTLGLPYDFVSEVLHENPEFKTMGELVIYMTKECRRELIKIHNTG